jgi:hypothetical protein
MASIVKEELSNNNTTESNSIEKANNAFKLLMDYLEVKEKDIKEGKVSIQEKTVVINNKNIEKKLSTVELSQLLKGWNSNRDDLKVLNLDKYHKGGLHPFVLMVHLAFAEHYNLTLTPDIIWMVIVQNFSHHINLNAEKFRDMFVDHKGKKVISIIRDEFGPDPKNNDWGNVFPEFCEKITEIIGKQNSGLVLQNFSTTSRSDFMSYQVVLMDMTKEFFDYRVRTRCGIPKFNFKGSSSDWGEIKRKIKDFNKFGLESWVKNLEYFIDKIINIVNGKDEKSFLESFYKLNSTSGDEWVTGEILRLFPYKRLRKDNFKRFDYNPSIKGWGGIEGISTGSFPSGKTSVPFIWEYMGKNINMSFNTSGVIVIDNDYLELKNNVNVNVS